MDLEWIRDTLVRPTHRDQVHSASVEVLIVHICHLMLIGGCTL